MFDIGSARLKPLHQRDPARVCRYLNSVPNRISLTGHTDTTPYAGITGYTNWDLSTDRANAARRAMERRRTAHRTNLSRRRAASSVLFDPAHPRNPVNRRISIVVMTKEAEQEAQKTDLPPGQRTTAEAEVAPNTNSLNSG